MNWYNDNTVLLDAIAGSAEVVAAILAVAITVVAIVLELAATRFSHRITLLFLKEPINLWYLGLLVSTTLLCIWVSFASAELVGHAGILIAITVLISIALILLLPYFAWVFSFISPLSVVNKFLINALDAVVENDQPKALSAIDELQEIARSAIGRQDRSIAMASVDALTQLIIQYQKLKTDKGTEWNDFSEVLKNDPDFISMESGTLQSIKNEELWLEVKVFRQFLGLVPAAVPGTREVANLIGISTRKIAELEDPTPLRELAMRCFNSYLRSTINAHDPRTTYYLFHQYRLLGEHLLLEGDQACFDNLVEYFQIYGLMGYQASQPFLLEVAAHDLMQLICFCLRNEITLPERLLRSLIDMDQEYRTESQEESLVGVRRAQIIAACELKNADQAHWVTVLLEDLKLESPTRLEKIFKQFKGEHRQQFWEFTDRGTNFSYLAPELKGSLDWLVEALKR